MKYYLDKAYERNYSLVQLVDEVFEDFVEERVEFVLDMISAVNGMTPDTAIAART